MEVTFLRFPHLSEAIFDSLENKCLAACKEVSESWYVYLGAQKFLETRITKANIKQVEKVKKAMLMVQKMHMLQRSKDEESRMVLDLVLGWYDKDWLEKTKKIWRKGIRK